MNDKRKETAMTTTKNRTFWTSDNGRVVCESHLGYSATAELQAKPKARTLYGSCDTFRKMTKPEVAEWLAFLAGHDETEACEDCRGGW